MADESSSLVAPRQVVLGTVQLGLPYGRRRNATLMPEGQAFAILDAAWELGIRVFDTAEAYGESAVRLRRWLGMRGHLATACVCTKVQLVADADEPTVSARVAAALERFDGAAERLILTHGPVDPPAWDWFADAARAAGVAFGQSVYTPAEVARAGALGATRVQAPGNVYDLGALSARAATDTPVDIRSVYLQGLLLETPEDAERRVAGGGALAAAVGEAAALATVPAAALLVAALLRRITIRDRLVIGVDTPAELAVLIRAVGVDPRTIDEFVAVIDRCTAAGIRPGVLDPRTW